MKTHLGIAAAALVAFTGAASAQQTEVLFSHKNWQVSVVGWDDGSLGCVAEVSDPNESFSIWTFQDGSVRLQFYSSAWQFTDGDSADLQFEIDRRGAWSATASLTQNSALIDLPDNQSGVNLITEVARGSRLYLRDAYGADVQNYSLAGSSASIQALIDCGDVIQDPTPTNPFN